MANHTSHCRAAPSILAALVMMTAAGCSRTPDPDKVLDSMRSWAATARFTGERFRADAVTATYAAEIRDAALTALEDTRRQLVQGAIPAEAAARVLLAADTLVAALHQLDNELRTP